MVLSDEQRRELDELAARVKASKERADRHEAACVMAVTVGLAALAWLICCQEGIPFQLRPW